MRKFALFIALALAASGLHAQQTEADTGFGLQGTVSAMAAASTQYQAAPRSGSPVDGGFRVMLYPTWKLSSHWTIAGAYQVVSRPYYYAGFDSQGHGIRGNVVQGYLSYSQVWRDASIIVRAGELSSAFGSFPLRYDDLNNPLIDIPMQYGYYGSVATLNALPAAQVDATWKKLDGRVQFTNSSPANPRSITATDQYGDWAAGAGYTIRQGLRVGASAYRGPYLDRHYQFYFPGEAPPRDLPGTGAGLEAEWGYGHWNVRAEYQAFVMAYRRIRTFHEHTGYVEAQRALGPRWYAAARYGYLTSIYLNDMQSIEAAIGYRPAAGQIIKVSYEAGHSSATSQPDRTLAIQFVMSIHPLAFAGH